MSKHPNLANWEFEADEITAGIYKVRGTRNTGNQVERTGADPERLLVACKDDAQELEKEILRALKN